MIGCPVLTEDTCSDLHERNQRTVAEVQDLSVVCCEQRNYEPSALCSDPIAIKSSINIIISRRAGAYHCFPVPTTTYEAFLVVV